MSEKPAPTVKVDPEQTKRVVEMLKLLREGTNLDGLSWKALRDVGRG